MTYRHTMVASYIGYITQAIVNNFIPLLFVIFQEQFGLSLAQLTGLITLNFGVQLAVDALAALVVDKIGYRILAVAAHIICGLGLILLGVLPERLPNAYWGLLAAVVVNAIGGGIIEVIISPIVEALPNERKEASMSLLHSFYCWGFVLVVVCSTIFFAVAGLEHWPLLCLLWAVIPLGNCLLFTKVPLYQLPEVHEGRLSLKQLFSRRTFLLLAAAMICAGASEQAMSQWASLFAEGGLGVGKTLGDLLGPCLFAVLMGGTRAVLGSGKIHLELEKVLFLSCGFCLGSYLLAVWAPSAVGSLMGCALCGAAVGSLWPTTFSLAAKVLPNGGSAMYALLALAGDIGCGAGPGLVGLISNASEAGGFGLLMDRLQDSLKVGLLFAVVFPIAMLAVIGLLQRLKKSAAVSELLDK